MINRFGIRPEQEVDDRVSFEKAREENDKRLADWEETTKPKLEVLFESIKKIDGGEYDEVLSSNKEQLQAENMSQASTQSKTRKKKASKQKKKLIEEVRKLWGESQRLTEYMIYKMGEAKEGDESEKYMEDLNEKLERFKSYQVDPVRLQLD